MTFYTGPVFVSFSSEPEEGNIKVRVMKTNEALEGFDEPRRFDSARAALTHYHRAYDLGTCCLDHRVFIKTLAAITHVLAPRY